MYSRGNRHQDDMTATPEKYPQGFFKDKPCRECGALFKPQAPSHLYCSEDCVSKNNSRRYLEKTYGISYEDYMELYNKFEGRCHICMGKVLRLTRIKS